MSQVELALRVVGVALLSLVAVSVLRTRKRTHRTQAISWLAASVASFMLSSMHGAEQIFGAAIYPLTALCSTHPVWFWICARLLFSDRARLRTSDVVCVGAMGIAGVLYQSQFPLPVEVPTAVRGLGIAFGASSLVFACLAPMTVYFGMAGDLDVRRRQLRQWFVPAVSLYLATVVITQVVVLLWGHRTPRELVLLNLAIIDVVAAIALSSFLQVRTVNWVAAAAVPAIALSRLEQSVLDRLNRRFVSERLYARESLTISDLANLLGTQEHVLRRVINQGLGFRNFNDFLHTHRLKEAAKRLGDAQLRRIPVLTIALEVGYGSIGPFNREFKQRFGLTPSKYRRAQVTDSGIGIHISALGE